MSRSLVWVPTAVEPFINRLADAIAAHITASTEELVARAIAAMGSNPPEQPACGGVATATPEAAPPPSARAKGAETATATPSRTTSRGRHAAGPAPEDAPTPQSQVKTCSKCGF